jgi:coenzyme F420-0:L-glutamate ligase
VIVTPLKTSLFREGQSLNDFLVRHLPKLREKMLVVVTSKIVALAEGRVAPCPNEKAFEKIVKAESEWAVETKYTWLTIKNGMVLASAGIDRSNADGKCILLPTDSYRSATAIRKFLMARFKLKSLGVLITDSRLMPLREGITGVALGYAGFKGIRDYRGKPDLFNRKLTMTRTNVADSLATAAVVTMGEGRERQPLALIQNAPVVFTNRVSRKELLIDPQEDVYRPFFDRLSASS